MLDPGFEKDTYVTAYDIIPDNTAIVHHTILFLATEDQRAEAIEKNGADGRPGWPCHGASGLTINSGVDPESMARLLPVLSKVGGAAAMRELLSAGDAADQINALVEANPDGELVGVPSTFQMRGDLTTKKMTAEEVWDVTATLDGDVLTGTASTVVLMSTPMPLAQSASPGSSRPQTRWRSFLILWRFLPRQMSKAC